MTDRPSLDAPATDPSVAPHAAPATAPTAAPAAAPVSASPRDAAPADGAVGGTAEGDGGDRDPAAAGLPVPADEASIASELTRWERSWYRIDLWTPYATLALASVLALTNPARTPGERLAVLGLAALALVWVGPVRGRAAGRQQRTWRGVLYLVGLLAIATMLMSIDVVFFLFAVTGFLHAAWLRPTPMVYLGIAATAFVINTMTWGGFPRPTLEENISFLLLVLLQTVLIGVGVTGGTRMEALVEQRRRTVERLEATLVENAALHAQLLEQAHEAGIIEERRRLAREIHDTLAQGLTGVITQLQAADQRGDDPAAMRRHLDAATTLARDSLAEARRSVQALGPGALQHGRLTGALRTLAREWTDLTGVEVTVTANDVPDRLPAEVEVALLRVGQESLANVGRHAEASRVAIALSGLSDTLTLDVRDDGRGFDLAQDRPGRFGLETMRRRVEDVGGEFVVESAPGGGTAVSATVPLPEPSRSATTVGRP